jgi:perosamine synthetase
MRKKSPIRIPVANSDVSGNEEKYVVDAIRSSWISSTGKYLDRFEREFAELCNTRTSIGVCNGTVALHLALLGLDVGAGDEVIVPSLTYIATANAVRYLGAEPVFVDVDPATWCIDPDKVEAAITERTKAIIAVHLYGHPADMDRINAIAAKHNLKVVEDAAEAPLATYKGKPVGGLASVATFSFFGNKLFTCGEGGALTVNDPDLEKRIRLLRGQGMDPDRRYWFPVTGYNYRLTNVCAAMLCAQLERRDEIMSRRLAIYEAYSSHLSAVTGIGLQPQAEWATISPWLFCITVDEAHSGIDRDSLMGWLLEREIDTRPFFIPLHTMPPFIDQSKARGDNLPHTTALGCSGINLPTYTQMKMDEVSAVCEAIKVASRINLNSVRSRD